MSSRDKPFRNILPTGVGGIPGPHTHAATDVNSAVLAPARLASGTPAAGKYPDGTGVWTALPAGGSGDVVGPGSAVSGNLPSFSGTTGKIVADSGLAASAVASLLSGGPYQPSNANLTTIAGLTPTTGNVIQSVAGAWASRTMAQLKTSLAIVVADISDFVSAVATAITAERTAVRTLTNADVSSGTNTFPTFNQNTTGSAAKWTTGRTISIIGDLVYTSPSLDGSANVSAGGTLATVNSNTGTFGGAATVGQFSVNGKGLTTAAAAVPIQIAESQVTNLPTDLATLTSGLALVSGGTISGSGTITGPTFQTSVPGVGHTTAMLNGTDNYLKFYQGLSGEAPTVIGSPTGGTTPSLTMQTGTTATKTEATSFLFRSDVAGNSSAQLSAADVFLVSYNGAASVRIQNSGVVTIVGVGSGAGFDTWQVACSSTAAATSTTNVTIAGWSQAVTSPGTTAVYMVTLDPLWTITVAGTSSIIELLVDGVAQTAQMQMFGPLSIASLSKTWRITGLSAASHTFTARLRNTAGSTGATVAATHSLMTVERKA